jgi:thiol-disulfide isomerase/thioredoxin
MKIIRITAMWCTSCLLMKNRWEKVFKNYPDIDIIDYDFDEDEEEIKKYDIGTTLPVLIIYKDNKEITRIIGEKSKKQLAKTIGELADENI